MKVLFLLLFVGTKSETGDKKWSMDPTRNRQKLAKEPPTLVLDPTPQPIPMGTESRTDSDVETNGNVAKDHSAPCSMASFLRMPRLETRRWCQSLSDSDRSKEATVRLVQTLFAGLEAFAVRDVERDELRIRFDAETFETLAQVDNETELVVNELVAAVERLFVATPSDERSSLVKVLDLLGIDVLHFQVCAGATLVVAVLVMARQYGVQMVRHCGVGFVVKYAFILAWLVNLPIAYINELEQEKSKWKIAKQAMTPEGCDGRQVSVWTTVKGLLSFAQIKDPCEKWQQSLVDPIYKVSWLGVASQSLAEVISPAFKVITRNLRDSLDELLDGLGFYHQIIYTALAMSVLVLFFMWISNFRFKVSGILLGLEFGPEQNVSNNLSIEEIRAELGSLKKQLSIELKSSRALSVENIAPNTTTKALLPAASGDNIKMLKKTTKLLQKTIAKETPTHSDSEDSFEHLTE